jgi:hypothetical protein
MAGQETTPRVYSYGAVPWTLYFSDLGVKNNQMEKKMRKFFILCVATIMLSAGAIAISDEATAKDLSIKKYRKIENLVQELGYYSGLYKRCYDDDKMGAANYRWIGLLLEEADVSIDIYNKIGKIMEDSYRAGALKWIGKEYSEYKNYCEQEDQETDFFSEASNMMGYFSVYQLTESGNDFDKDFLVWVGDNYSRKSDFKNSLVGKLYKITN